MNTPNNHPTAPNLVRRRLDAGWRPAKTHEQLWVRGGQLHLDNERDVIVETYDESEPMSAAEEQALIDHWWSTDG
jgi:hypothetical protein